MIRTGKGSGFQADVAHAQMQDTLHAAEGVCLHAFVWYFCCSCQQFCVCGRQAWRTLDSLVPAPLACCGKTQDKFHLFFLALPVSLPARTCWRTSPLGCCFSLLIAPQPHSFGQVYLIGLSALPPCTCARSHIQANAHTGSTQHTTHCTHMKIHTSKRTYRQHTAHNTLHAHENTYKQTHTQAAHSTQHTARA